MRNFRFAFYVTEKVRTHKWGQVLAQGAKVHGDVVDIHHKDDFTGPLADYDGCGNMGLSRAAKRLMDEYLGEGKFFLFFDKGYSARGQYMRVSVNAWQPLAYFQRFMRPSDRMEAVGFHIKRRQKRDGSKVVVFAGSCQSYANFMGLGNVNDYNLSVLQKLRDHTDRTIVYRPNPSWYNKHRDEFRPIHEEVARVELSVPEVPFVGELERCHLLVTHGTSAAVAAVSSGINSMVLGPGICRPLSITEQDWDKIETPPWPKEGDREQFFADLHYCQWTEEEYRDGTAWAEIRLVLASLSAEKGPVIGPELLGQYQLMHGHPNYFRGLTTLKYADQIGEVLSKHDIESILDYGSGKGEQYEPPNSLQEFWGVRKVVCYDPAVPKFSKPPKGMYDAIICCDVMEHIPEKDVPQMLQTIIGHAAKVVFFAIATSPAIKTLPDGRNCHVTVRPKDWWREQIATAVQVVRNPQYPEYNPVIELVTTSRGDDSFEVGKAAERHELFPREY